MTATESTTASKPNLCDRIVAAHNAAYAASNATREAAIDYAQAAGVAVMVGDWKLAIEFDAKSKKLRELADSIYATMIGN